MLNKFGAWATAVGLSLQIVAGSNAMADELPASINDTASTDTIKVGILHSLTGTMAITEAALKDTLMMLIDEQNQKGGVLGKKIEPVVLDPASDWEIFEKQSQDLLTQENVSAVFGCWTSISRKAVLPALEKYNGLLFYPAQYEGEESSRNIIYTGAAPNQQLIPAVAFLMSEVGAERFVLVGTDYVYPRTANKIIAAYLKALGVPDSNIMINYTPFGQSDWKDIVADIKKFGNQGIKTAVISTLNGDSNLHFYHEYNEQGITSDDIPVLAFSIGEGELAGMETAKLAGHYAAWNYFESVKSPENDHFIAHWHEWTNDNNKVTNDPMEATYIGFNLWVKAVEKANSTKVDDVLNNIVGLSTPNLTGGHAQVLPNHHITKPVYIGKILPSGQFEVVWFTDQEVAGDAWSDFLPSSKHIKADWTNPINCGAYDTTTDTCLLNR